MMDKNLSFQSPIIWLIMEKMAVDAVEITEFELVEVQEDKTKNIEVVRDPISNSLTIRRVTINDSKSKGN